MCSADSLASMLGARLSISAHGADDQTARNYEGRAAEFSAWAEEAANAVAATRLRKRFLSHCAMNGRSTALRLLDLGCGSGRDVREFAAGGHSVVGIEPCAAFVRIAKSSHLDVRLGGFHDLERWAQELPLPLRDGLDGIFCLASIFHCAREELPSVLHAVCALLRPGGVLLTTLPCSAVASSSRGKDGRWMTCLPLAAHKAAVQGAGLEIIEADDGLRLYNGSWGTVIARRPLRGPRIWKN